MAFWFVAKLSIMGFFWDSTSLRKSLNLQLYRAAKYNVHNNRPTLMLSEFGRSI